MDMTRQDTDDGQSSPDDPSEHADPDGEEPEGHSESVEEIAEKPDGDIDEVLADILDTDESDRVTELTVDPESVEVDQALLDRIEDHTTEELARAIASLQTENKALREELEEAHERADDFESRLKRKQADFQNYKKRQKTRLEEEKQRATEDLVERLLDVRDNLARALDQDESVDIRDGIETTLGQFDQELDRENVAVIEPAPGEEVDPQRHEVLIRIESSQQEDTVAELHRPGYEMAGKVLRPAQVAVSDGTDEEPAETDNSEEKDRGEDSSEKSQETDCE